MAVLGLPLDNWDVLGAAGGSQVSTSLLQVPPSNCL